MKKELWLRLKGYHFDDLVPPHLADRVSSMFGRTDPSTHTFAHKLARKLDWTNRFALRAIDEYKKFVFLGVTTQGGLTPSKVIDQVWHEHILFSRAYREFCRDVLQQDFDHNPELVPSEKQTDLFKTQFDATIAAYEREFSVAPPSEIWGTPKFKDTRSRVPRDDGFIDGGLSSSGNDTPLFMLFDVGDGGAASMAEFGGGGGFSGGGGGDSWSTDSTSTHSSSGDSSSSSDSSSSCSSGSSCSSSCGGAGCGS